MFCRHCGNSLGDEDRFCSGCGTKVEREEGFVVQTASEGRILSNDFKPSFTREREPISFAKDDRAQDEKKPKRVFQKEDFSWDLDGFPDTEGKKTEEVDFNWESVMEEKMRNTGRAAFVNSEEEAEGFAKPEEPAEEPVIDEAEDLEEFLFKGMDKTPTSKPTEDEEKVDKFYTFNKKNEEFQALLDKEYEKLKMASHGEVPEPKEEPAVFTMDKGEEDLMFKTETFVSNFDKEEPVANQTTEDLDEFLEVELEKEEAIIEDAPVEEADDLLEDSIILDPVTPIERDEEDQKVETAEESFDEDKEIEEASEVIEAELVGEEESEALDDEPKELEADDSNEDADSEASDVENEPAEADSEENAETEESETSTEPVVAAATSETPEKKKLRFEDIFNDDDEEDEPKKVKKAKKEKKTSAEGEEDKPGKKVGGFVKGVFYFILVLAIIALGIKYFAKDSVVAQKIDEGYYYVISKITGESQTVQKVEKVETPTSNLDTWINDGLSVNENIEQVLPDYELRFVIGKDYGFEEIEKAAPFVNGIWHSVDGDNGKENVYYGEKIVEAVIKYFSDAAGENEERLSKLEIGEIRTGEFGFYVIVKTTKSVDGQDEVSTEVLYLEPEDTTLVVKDMKTFEEGEN